MAHDTCVFFGNRSRVGSLENKGFVNHDRASVATKRAGGAVGLELVHC